jgi:hypothetical protein
MDGLSRDITAVAMGVIGVAILGVLFVRSNQTANIIGSASSGFANVLSVAMGGGSSSTMYGMH